MIVDGRLKAAVDARYAGWDTAQGQATLAGAVTLAQLADQVLAANVDVQPVSGRQEALENLVNRYCGN
jgi:xylose isomerase